MSRIRTGIKPGQWEDEGPARATVKAGHIQGSIVVGDSTSPRSDAPRDDLAKARRRAAYNAKRAQA